jgi:hypothetical protein
MFLSAAGALKHRYNTVFFALGAARNNGMNSKNYTIRQPERREQNIKHTHKDKYKQDMYDRKKYRPQTSQDPHDCAKHNKKYPRPYYYVPREIDVRHPIFYAANDLYVVDPGPLDYITDLMVSGTEKIIPADSLDLISGGIGIGQVRVSVYNHGSYIIDDRENQSPNHANYRGGGGDKPQYREKNFSYKKPYKIEDKNNQD